MTGPGVLWIVVARFTATRGIVYVVRNLNCVRYAAATWHARRLGPGPGAASAVNTAPCELEITSQLSVVVRPVLTPPCMTTPFCRRALALKSTPFQCSVCLPKSLASVVYVVPTPTLAGLTLYSPSIT